jgi:SAM-dependent methyltransferase
MTGVFRSSTAGLTLPGRPFDYINTPVLMQEHRDVLGQRDVLMELWRDEVSLPKPEAREGYYGPRHVEYWLSGFRDAQKVLNATDLSSRPHPRILDFGGSSGRTVRHFRTLCSNASLFLCDIDPQHVLLVRDLFRGSVRAFRNSSTPALPFADHFFDCVVAFSVFTHMDTEDVGWLLELRRVTKKGGYMYVTVHDEATWESLSSNYVGQLSLQNADLAAYRSAHPKLDRKVVHFYNEAADYSCNVFINRQYLEAFWFPLIGQSSVQSLVHEYQAAVVMRVN